MDVRKILLPFSLLLFFPLLVAAQNLGGNPSSLKWRQVNNNSVRVIFPEGLDSQANRINNIIRLLDSTTMPTIGSKQRKWNIVLLNQTTIPNAYVRLAPVISEFNMLPGQNNFSNGSLRWDDNLAIHENRHMQQFANANTGLTKVFSFFLGQEGQLFANGLTIPDYFFEGDAVWQETLVSAQGRGRMPYFYNGLRSLAMGNKNYSWMKLRSGSLKDYTPDHYELGYQMVAYGNEKYGTGFWKKVIADAVHFKGLFYSFNKAIEKYSGKTYPQFRQDALGYFKEQTITQNKNTDGLVYITEVKKSTVADYLFPVFVNDDTILVTKQSYKKPSAFYYIINGKEKRIRVKNTVLDEYFSYSNGRVVYASYQTGPRWLNKDFNVLQLLDIHTKKQRQLTFKSKYFSPDINADGSEVLAVNVSLNGTSSLHRLSTGTGGVIARLPNPKNYFYTQTKYLDGNHAISAARNPAGEMALVKVDLTSGETEAITPFSFNVLGYPFVKGDTVYYNAMDNSSPSDKIFAVSVKDKKIYQLTDNVNGIYQPALNTKGALLVSAFTADGYRLATVAPAKLSWRETDAASIKKASFIGAGTALSTTGAGALYKVSDTLSAVTKYSKSFQLFNFHSWRGVINDPEYGYTFYSDNILTSFSNALTYTYNRVDKSHTVGFNGVFAGWFPVLSLGAEESFNRQVDTAFGKRVQFNSGKLNATINIPLSFAGGRTSKYVNFGASYNMDFFTGIGKGLVGTSNIKYLGTFVSFSNVSRQARQNINPAWAQSISINYRDAFNFRNSHKLVGSGSLYFPGLFANHSLVVNGAYQTKDTLPDLFSNIFPYSRGYDGLSQRKMYKVGANYHFPLFYPDWGFGNIVFFQRIRTNAFYDHTVFTARFTDGMVRDVKARSAGAEVYFDTKLWNALKATFTIRFSHLMDINYGGPRIKNRWEFILPIGLIPD